MSFIPQSYPLWAVRAYSDGAEYQVGLVVGWLGWLCDGSDDEGGARPIVAALSEAGCYVSPRDWHSEIDRSDGDYRAVIEVEICSTLEQAEKRGPELVRSVVEGHVRLWPQDASSYEDQT